MAPKAKSTEENGSYESELRAKHEELKADLAKKMEVQKFWEETLAAEPMKAFIREYQDTIQRSRVELEDCKGGEVARIQADIRCRKDLIIVLESKKSPMPVTEARRRLTEFESQNDLLLGGK